MVLTLLEEKQFVTDAFADEDAAGVLGDYGFLVLCTLVSVFHSDRKERVRVSNGNTNLMNSIFDLLRLPRFNLVGGFITDTC
jgi:hypothetical protein